jgi:hypothetical protein
MSIEMQMDLLFSARDAELPQKLGYPLRRLADFRGLQ